MKAVTSLPGVSAEPDRLIKLSEAARLFGVDQSSLRKLEAPRGVEELTFVDISKPGAERRSLRLVYSECVALRDKLIQTSRQRTDVGRMLKLVVNDS
jgi:hypothetical protein